MSLKLDGKQAAAKTFTRKRAVLYNALDYAVELQALGANNLGAVKWTAPKTVRAVDKRVVINVRQGERLLDAVAAQVVEGQPRRSSGPMLRAFFAVMYYAASRPEEAAMLCPGVGRRAEGGVLGAGVRLALGASAVRPPACLRVDVPRGRGALDSVR